LHTALTNLERKDKRQFYLCLTHHHTRNADIRAAEINFWVLWITAMVICCFMQTHISIHLNNQAYGVIPFPVKYILFFQHPLLWNNQLPLMLSDITNIYTVSNTILSRCSIMHKSTMILVQLSR